MKIADMHCDTIYEIYERRARGEECGFLSNSLHIDLEKMKKGDYLLQNFALFVPKEDVEGKMPLPEYALRLADVFFSELRKAPDAIGIVKSYADIEENRKQGRMSAMLSMEEGAACEGKLEYLRIFYELGVRMFTFTWNYPNELAWPNRIHLTGLKAGACEPETERGLTEKGFEFLEEMERLGMIPDVSHLGDKGIYDVIAHAKRPFVASHSNARAVCGNVRNLTDDMIRKLALRGGVMGLNFCPSFLDEGAEESGKPVLEAIVRHAKHIVNTGGIECLGLGSDFDGIPTPKGLEGAGRMPVLDDEFQKAGFSASQREKIFSGNVLRLYRDTLPE